MVFHQPIGVSSMWFEVDVRMRILGSFSTAHWLNPPCTAVPGKNLHFWFSRGHRSVESGIPGIRISPVPVPLVEALCSSVITV